MRSEKEGASLLEMALSGMVAGDLTGLTTATTSLHTELIEASRNLSTLTLTRNALIRVIAGWCDGLWSDRDVQNWASLVRRGYVAGSGTGAVEPILFDYQEDREDAIVEIMSRLDEIGDAIDGEISDAERGQMLSALRGER